MKGLVFAHEYAVTVSNWFTVLATIEDSVELWDTYKQEILQLAGESVEECSR